MRKVYFHNTLSGKMEEFFSIDSNTVSIYTCGPTVYDSSHIGHARGMLVWDILVRTLQGIGYKVNWSRNITDIDDKIINRSYTLNISPDQLARIQTYKFWDDMHKLNISVPHYEPRATEHLPDIFKFIEELLTNDSAYQITNGDIYLHVPTAQHYGQLKNIAASEDNISRVSHNSEKKDPRDFVLWKAFSEDNYGYHSPFGYGRPGWHLECSAMIKKLFGPTIDIHGGGEDLIFPHHENEIAQSECLHNKPLANYWLHNGMIMINGKKMSKSENNYITIQDCLKKYSSNAIRYFTLTTHYRQSINYTDEALQAAQNSINKILSTFRSSPELAQTYFPNSPLLESFWDSLCNDLHTPQALSHIHTLLHQHNNYPSQDSLQAIATGLQVLGFNLSECSNSALDINKFSDLFTILLEVRDQARKNKEYLLSDRIRDSFHKAELEIQDTPNGSKITSKHNPSNL